MKLKNFPVASWLVALVALSAMTVMWSCGSRTHEVDTLTVSIPPQKYLLDAIVGDKMRVNCLLSNGADPETYDPSMSHLINVENSVAYFQIGGIGFEDAVTKRIKTSRPDLKIIDTSTGIEFINGTHHGHDADPHVWTSTANARIIAHNMYEAVAGIDPGNASYYKSNLDKLIAHIDSIDAVIKSDIAVAPSTTFVIWHPSLSYFARDYGLTQIALGAEHKEASVNELRQQIDRAKASGATIMFLQPETDNRQTAIVNAELDLPTTTINPLSYNWDEQMVSIGKNLATPSSVVP